MARGFFYFLLLRNTFTWIALLLHLSSPHIESNFRMIHISINVCYAKLSNKLLWGKSATFSWKEIKVFVWARLNLFGSTEQVEVCRISGCGVRPIVTCAPAVLHWGQVRLLTRTYKTLTLCNDSPVIVNFKVSLVWSSPFIDSLFLSWG